MVFSATMLGVASPNLAPLLTARLNSTARPRLSSCHRPLGGHDRRMYLPLQNGRERRKKSVSKNLDKGK